MENILRRDRALVIAALAVLTVLSWIYLAVLAQGMAQGDMTLMGMGADMGKMAMNGTPGLNHGWTTATFILMLVMWWVMMVGMMVPSAAPMILLFAMITRKQTDDGNPNSGKSGFRIALFISAYLIIWGGFSLAATLAQWGLTEAALLSSMMAGNSRWLLIGLLLACGVYQLSPLKQACLGKCRSPLSFIMTGWRPGDMGALRMGLSHGAYCVGCCWLLMGLLFVGGVMNLFWVALIAILVLAEKVLPRGDLFGKAGGGVMIGLAGFLLLFMG
jgi:predicted metal-binding membrane protein